MLIYPIPQTRRGRPPCLTCQSMLENKQATSCNGATTGGLPLRIFFVSECLRKNAQIGLFLNDSKVFVFLG